MRRGWESQRCRGFDPMDDRERPQSLHITTIVPLKEMECGFR